MDHIKQEVDDEMISIEVPECDSKSHNSFSDEFRQIKEETSVELECSTDSTLFVKQEFDSNDEVETPKTEITHELICPDEFNPVGIRNNVKVDENSDDQSNLAFLKSDEISLINYIEIKVPRSETAHYDTIDYDDTDNTARSDYIICNECQYVCNVCDSVFPDEKTLITHKSLKHSNKNDYTLSCEDCQSTFDCTSLLHDHRTIILDFPFNCYECNIKFYSICTLRKHNMIEHPEKKVAKFNKKIVFRCKKCPNFTCGTREEMDVHITARHAKKRYSCDDCPYTTYGLVAFRDHTMSHKKTHACDVCGYKTRTKGRLNKHRKVHLEQQLPSCLLCKNEVIHTEHVDPSGMVSNDSNPI